MESSFEMIQIRGLAFYVHGKEISFQYQLLVMGDFMDREFHSPVPNVMSAGFG